MHPTQPLAMLAAVKVLREHAEGRSVDPSRLDWAVTMALQNPQRITLPVRPA